MHRMDNLLCISLITLIYAAAGQDCGEWSAHGSHCYKMENEQRSWHDAESWCMENGGHLASIENEAERNFIHGISRGFHMWIGLNQLSDRNGNYMWSDGSTSEFKDWAAGQPVDGGLQQCVYTEVPYTHPGDCFDRNDGKSTIEGLLDKPGDASPPDTFHFGSWDEDEEGIQLCMEACRDYGESAECHSYTFISNLYTGDPDWTGACVGRSNQFDVEVSVLWAYSGSRIPCKANYNSSNLWYSSNCGAPLGYICKKPVDSGGPITDPPPQDVISYCPVGYFNIAGGNKCFKVVTTSTEASGKTWDEALQECRAGPGINPDLASISSETENAEVLAVFKNYSYGTWIGYFVDVRSERFLWADNSNPVYANWDDSQPNSPETNTCTKMWIHPGKPGTWSSLGCGTRRGYVCQTFKDTDNPIQDTPNPPVSCRAGWTSYWYACYKLNTEGRSWQEAEDLCVNEQSHLVSIHSEMENSAVFAFTQHMGHIWTGFHKVDDKYQWTDGWVDRYTNWGDGGTEGGEGCVEMLEQGKWKDEDCGKTHPFLCKYSYNPVLTTPILTEGYCPEGWPEWGDHCYSFNIGTTQMTWDDAEVNCQESAGDSYSGHLVSVHSFLENEYLLVNLEERSESASAWIGLKRGSKEGWFEWSDGSPLDYEFWALNRPDGDAYDIICGELLFEGGMELKGVWNDEQCPSQRDTYVCKTPKAPLTTTTLTLPTITPTLPPPGDHDCPSGSEKYGDFCYMFHPNEVLSFEQALDSCVTDSGGKATLASVHDDTENWFIHSRMRELAVNKENQHYWIGLYRQGQEGILVVEVAHDCFSKETGRNRISGIIDKPSDASPPETFHFGKWTKNKDDAEAVEWCISECMKVRECFAYNFDSVMDGNSDTVWKGHCVGRSIDYSTDVSSFWSYSGERYHCAGKKDLLDSDFQWVNGNEVNYENWTPDRDLAGSCGEMMSETGEWDDVSCGTQQGYVCRWEEDGQFGTVPVTTTTPTTSTRLSTPSQTTPGACPTESWVMWNDYCYLFANDVSTWEDSQTNCLSQAGDLVSILSSAENTFIANQLSSRGEANAWTGLFYNDTGSFEWIDGSPVSITFWAPGEPSASSELDSCTRVNVGGLWYTYSCSTHLSYICKLAAFEPTSEPEPERSQPQYQVRLYGNFSSDNGDAFTQQCIVQYASSLNQKALQVSVLANSLIGSQVCAGAQPDDIRIVSASCPMSVDENEGSTNPTFYLSLGSNLVLENVETCASEVTELLLPHSNWGEPLIPNIPGCPGVSFEERQFTHDQNQWLCTDSMAVNQGATSEFSFTVPLHYGFTHSGSFHSEFGDDISMDCMNRYNTEFNIKTFEMVQTTNGEIASGELCQGSKLSIVTASAFLLVDGSQGLTSQNYAIQPLPDMLFSEVYQCSDEISGFLTHHNNWVTPILPQLPGCPAVEFDPDLFQETSHRWICVPAL